MASSRDLDSYLTNVSTRFFSSVAGLLAEFIMLSRSHAMWVQSASPKTIIKV